MHEEIIVIIIITTFIYEFELNLVSKLQTILYVIIRNYMVHNTIESNTQNVNNHKVCEHI